MVKQVDGLPLVGGQGLHRLPDSGLFPACRSVLRSQESEKPADQPPDQRAQAAARESVWMWMAPSSRTTVLSLQPSRASNSSTGT